VQRSDGWDLIDKFSEYLSFNLRFSENTIKSYTHDIELFFKFLSSQNIKITAIQNLTLNDFRMYFSFRITERKNKASSNARAISSLKSFFSFLEKSNIVSSSEIQKIKFPKLPKTLPKALKENEIVELIENFEEQEIENSWESLRNKALVTLIYSAGLRISEALSLNKKDFHKNTFFLKIKGKGSKERFVPLLEKAKEEMSEYINSLDISLLPDYPVFINGKRDKKTGKPKRLTAREVQKIIQNSRERLNLPKFTTPHALRHSFATHIIENGGNIRNVQSLLGHSSLSTTQKYVKVDEKLLAEAYKKFHPNN
jgi:integrase/recombinase XerC